jgi:hypothetical protein
MAEKIYVYFGLLGHDTSQSVHGVITQEATIRRAETHMVLVSMGISER